MSKFLTDGVLSYLTIGKEELDTINNKLEEIVEEENKKLSTNSISEFSLRANYFLRADGKGVKYLDYAEMKKEFCQAKRIEWLIIIYRTKNNRGKGIELHFHTVNNRSTYLIEDDNNSWVEGATTQITNILKNFKNNNYIFYSGWFVAFFQIFGVIIMFLSSVWLGLLIAPLLKINNALIFVFIGLFLLFSNIWTFVLMLAKAFIEKKYPHIQFNKKSNLHWLLQGLAVAIVFYFLIHLLSFIYEVLFKS